jgi:hypothetical protein
MARTKGELREELTALYKEYKRSDSFSPNFNELPSYGEEVDQTICKILDMIVEGDEDIFPFFRDTLGDIQLEDTEYEDPASATITNRIRCTDFLSSIADIMKAGSEFKDLSKIWITWEDSGLTNYCTFSEPTVKDLRGMIKTLKTVLNDDQEKRAKEAKAREYNRNKQEAVAQLDRLFNKLGDWGKVKAAVKHLVEGI